MELQELIQSGNYLDEFKKHRVVYRKYPELNLMIVKRKYGSNYSSDYPWLNYCRGLVIDTQTNKIVFCPPIKSVELNTIDEIETKGDVFTQLIDGTMINLFYHNNTWFMSTRSNIGCNNQWSSDINFKQMFSECSPNFDYDNLDTSLTYSFVMRHTNNRIISPVHVNELYLVEVRDNLQTMKFTECPNNTYKIAQTLTRDSLRNFVQDNLIKGFTITTDNRYKWLSSHCKFINMIKPNTNNELLNYLTLRNSGYLTDYLEYFFNIDLNMISIVGLSMN